MIIRLSQKLNAKIKAGSLADFSLEENPFADWSAHLFVADRTQYILFSNTKSLYSTVLNAQGITADDQFINRCLDSLDELMDSDGLLNFYLEHVVPAAAKLQFAKSLNRRVTSSMNELILAATHCLSLNGRSPHQTSLDINDMLLSAIAAKPGGKYGRPLDAFMNLVKELPT